MLTETIDGLNINPDGVYVDGTFGGGGHSQAILQRLSDKGHLYAFDQDENAFRNKIDDPRITLIHSNFRYVGRWLRYFGANQVDGFLGDLGVSSHQLDDPDRGFAFRHKELALPLDMRMGKEAPLSAADLLNTYDAKTLESILKEYGEVWNASKLVTAIINYRKKTKIQTIGQFVQLASPFTIGQVNQYMAKVFQALRIAVNNEMDVLKAVLEDSIQFIKPGGRLVILSYHSLEDRMVKHVIQTGNVEGIINQDQYGNKKMYYKAITKKPLLPNEKEVKENYRARSARLRIAEKLAE
ncbi:MAG: 16S rRNA (cytosine(1402)-N(4))-methyltransferase RsmH [Saprospiraceae bacterium]|nr:16S rRNA (cytosine(1402)-N(4))-methyltransferase RsmH [Saprospiraceae bacterium]